MFKTPLVLVSSLLALSACSSNKSKSTGQAEQAKTAKAAQKPAADGLKDHVAIAGGALLAAVEITIWPEHWQRVQQALTNASGLPAEALGPDAGPYLLVAKAMITTGFDQPAMSGIDETRPYSISLTPPDFSFETIVAAVASKQELPPERFPRVRMTLPAKDVDALAKAFMDATRSSEAQPLGDMQASADAALRVTRHSDSISVDMIAGAKMPQSEAGLRAALGLAPTEPARPAFAIPSKSALRAIVRAHELADLGTATGMVKVIDALEFDEGPGAHLLLVQGSAELLSAYLVMDPAWNFGEVLMLEVPLAADAKAQIALRVAATARDALASTGLRDTASPLGDIDWLAVAGAIPALSVFGQGASSAEFAELFHECGWACWGHLPFASGLQMIGALARDGKLAGSMAMAKEVAGPHMPRARLDGEYLVIAQSEPIGTERWQGVAYPMSGAHTSKASLCYRAAAVTVQQALKSLVGADPAHHDALLSKANIVFEKSSDCARAERPAAQRFDALNAYLQALQKLIAS